MEFENNLKGKKVFLTGHTGFKGSWMLAVLNNLGAMVKGYSLPPQHANGIYNLINGNDLCESIFANINDSDKLKNEIIDFEPDFIFHLAAQPLVRLSYSIPIDTFQTNVIGTANLLDSLIDYEKECTVVIITTDKVYHNNEWEYPYRECDKLGGYDPYSASKACCELVVNSFRNSFFAKAKIKVHGKKIVTARAGNVIGGGDRAADRIIPDIIRAYENNTELEVRNSKSIRPWQHILEPIFGYIKLASQVNQSDNFEDAWNFGPHLQDCLEVGEIVNTISVTPPVPVKYDEEMEGFLRSIDLPIDIIPLAFADQNLDGFKFLIKDKTGINQDYFNKILMSQNFVFAQEI